MHVYFLTDLAANVLIIISTVLLFEHLRRLASRYPRRVTGPRLPAVVKWITVLGHVGTSMLAWVLASASRRAYYDNVHLTYPGRFSSDCHWRP